MSCSLRNVITKLNDIGLFLTLETTKLLSKWVVLIYTIACGEPVYNTLFSIGIIVIFNTFALLIGIILVSLHFFGYLNIFKLQHVFSCMFANCASSYGEYYLSVLSSDKHMEGHHCFTATDKEYLTQRIFKIALTGCSTVMDPMQKMSFVNEITNVFIPRNRTYA